MMKRKLIVEGNAVYELDEKCMLKKRLQEVEKEKKEKKEENENEMGTGVF